MKKRYSEEQIIGFLREADAGLPIKELCRKHGFSEASYYAWKAKFGGMNVSDAQRLKALEAENTKLKKLLANSMLEVDAMREVLPEFQPFDIPLDHAIRRTLFEVSEVPQVPGINFWRATGGGTAERGTDSPFADFRGIADDHGRLMVVMTHNTDIGDSMERESEDPEFFAEFSPKGYAVTIDMVLYALTH